MLEVAKIHLNCKEL